MNDMPFNMTPMRACYHPRRPKLPENVKYYRPFKNEDNKLTGFSLEWLMGLSELLGVGHKEILVAMSDGSVSSDGHGGCGFFAALLSYVEELSVEEMCSSQFDRDGIQNADAPNGVANFVSSSAAVSRRASIEFCELKGVESMLRSLLELTEAVVEAESDVGVQLISLSVDSLSVADWIGGVSLKYGVDVL